MAVITTLPVEVLSEIFLRAIGPRPYPNLCGAPINVSQTCRSWREILLGNGRFWGSLYADYHESDLTDDVDEEDLLEAHSAGKAPRPAVSWLLRTSNADINFNLNFAIENVTFGRRSESDDMISALSFKQRNWKSIILNGPPLNNCPLPLFDLPRLSYLNLLTNTPFQSDFSFSSLSERSWNSEPALFQIVKPTSNSQPLAPCLTQICIPYFYATAKSITGLLDFFQQCPSLHTLDITSGNDHAYNIESLMAEDSPLSSTEPIWLKQLQTLIYTSCEPQASLLSWMRTPNLRTLHLNSNGTTPAEGVGVAKFLEASKAPIELAVFTDRVFDERVGHRILKALPSIKFLAFATNSGFLVDRLFGKTPSTSLCPSLQKIRLAYNPIDIERLEDVFFRIQEWLSRSPGCEVSLILPSNTDDTTRLAFETVLARYNVSESISLDYGGHETRPHMFGEGVFTPIHIGVQ